MNTTALTPVTNAKPAKNWSGFGWLLLIGGFWTVLVMVVILLLAYQYAPDFKLDFNSSQPTTTLPAYVKGLYGPEHNSVASYRWSEPEFGLTISGVAAQDFKLNLATFGNPPGNENQMWTVWANNQEVTTFIPSGPSAIKSNEIVIPAKFIKNGKLAVQLSGTAFRSKDDNRILGLPVTYLDLQGQLQGWARPPKTVFFQSILLALLFGALIAPFWYLAAAYLFAKQNSKRFLTFGLLGLSLAVPALYLGGSYRLNPFAFNNLDALVRVAILAVALEYALLAIVWVLQIWLRQRSTGRVMQTEQASVTDKQSTAALTGLRYLAALMVFVEHLPPDTGMPPLAYNLVHSGYTGVGLFFILSGFVLCYNYYGSLSHSLSKSALRSFWVARFARVYPMYVVCFGLALWLMPLQRQPDWPSAALHLTMLQSFSPDVPLLLAYNLPAWSVGVEAFFYLLFPFLIFGVLRWFKTIPQLLACMVALICVQVGIETATNSLNWHSQEYFFYYFPPGRLVEFILGILTALIFMRLQQRVVSRGEQRLASLIFVICLLIAGGTMSLDKSVGQVYRYGIYYAPFFAFVIFYLVRYRTRLSGWLATPALLLLGESSYAFYLLHDIVINKLVPVSSKAAGSGYDYLLFAGELTGITALSILATVYYETPVRFWLRQHLVGAYKFRPQVRQKL